MLTQASPHRRPVILRTNRYIGPTPIGADSKYQANRTAEGAAALSQMTVVTIGNATILG